jgi:hypothetical protein
MVVSKQRYMSREHCGTVIYRGKVYDVHWDNNTNLVFVSKLDNPHIHNINYANYRAESKEHAPKAAIEMLVNVLGKDFTSM